MLNQQKSEPDNLAAALYYSQALGLSVIPIKEGGKVPHVKWESFQRKPASMDQIKKWWGRWPTANVGIVTGSASKNIVVDIDTEAGWKALNEFLPNSFMTPTCKTPGGGWHVYFDYRPGLSNAVRIIQGCDLRTDGGYIVAPPSSNGNGKKYEWLPGLKITDIDPQPMPDFLFETLLVALRDTSERPSSQLNKEESFNKKNSSRGGDEDPERNNSKQSITKRNISFDKGGRDESLFHLANHLVKGGMALKSIREYLEFFASKCNPPFPEKEVEAKIQSALKRANSCERNLTQEIRDWISVTKHNFSVTFLWQAQQIVTKEDKAKVRTILNRLVKEGLIEHTGTRAGEYRIIEKDCEPEDWQSASTDTVDLWLPFELDTVAIMPPGSITTLAGSPNSGKTAMINSAINEELTRAKKAIAKPGADVKANQEIIVKLTAEIRRQLALQASFYETWYKIEGYQAFQDEFLQLLEEISPELRNELISRLRKRRALRGLIQPN
jgi:hypothetical protein